MTSQPASSLQGEGTAQGVAGHAQPRVWAVVPVDLDASGLGPSVPCRVMDEIQGRAVLAHTLARVARIAHLQGVIVVCSHEHAPRVRQVIAGVPMTLPVQVHETAEALRDRWHAMTRVARLTSPAAWRAGLGGATAYDEVLCAGAAAEALAVCGGTAAVLVGPDWVLVDPQITSQVVQIHVDYPEAMQMTFSQAPPGLAGVLIARELLVQMAENHATIGQLISYNPQRPQADPIGRDVCAQIPAAVRDCPYRMIYDTPRSVAMVDELASQLDAATFTMLSAEQVVAAAGAVGEVVQCRFLPREVTVELTPRRGTVGALLPQFHVDFPRQDMSLEVARRVVRQISPGRDTFLVLGGLGDALLHPQWRDVVGMAREAGVACIGVETDLLVDQEGLEELLSSGVDVISVRVNADTEATYRRVMTDGGEDGAGRFKQCIENLQWLLNRRNARWQGEDGKAHCPGLPWIVPSLVKTNETFGDMETFFDRWMVYTGAAAILPSQTGCGLMPDDSPVRMTPPRRRACRQLAQRLTILSDGSIALCDQDWLGRGGVGRVQDLPLSQAMARLQAQRLQHQQGQWDAQPLCGSCGEWFRP